MSSTPSPHETKIHIYGHVSAQPKALAEIFDAEHLVEPVAESDLAIFAINPSAGIDLPTIDLWEQLSEFQPPRIVVVNGLEAGEYDFDDAVLLANRVFDNLVTPYLVLHDDSGGPTALIDLQTLEIIDYSTPPPTRRDSEPEHKEIVAEFREEYLEAVESAGEGAFEAGLLFPAIPVVLSKHIGVDIVKNYIARLSNF